MKNFGYIPNAPGYKQNRDGFIYDPENDRYNCPNGKHLTFRHLKKKGDNTHKIYKTGVKDFAIARLKLPASIHNLKKLINGIPAWVRKEAEKVTGIKSQCKECLLTIKTSFEQQ